jgi:hypothetical protein
VQCRLLTNIILDSRFIERGSIIDDEALPAHLKENASVITYDIDSSGQAMLLKEMHYSTCYRDHEGFNVTRPVMLGAGELIDADQIPPEWKEGTDFKYGWSPEERRQIQARSEAEYVQQFQPKSEEPYENVGYHRVRSQRR